MNDAFDAQPIATEVSTLLDSLKLLNRIQGRLRQANQSWELFSSNHGDILYFSDITDFEARDCFHKIAECFEALEDLEKNISMMVHEVQAGVRIVSGH